MATTTPAPTPTPASTPAPAPAAPPSVFSNWENYITMLVVILGALPSTFLKGSSSETLQIVGLIAATLSALLTHTNVTSLRKAHLVHQTALALKSAA
jgi:hypothetical protein